MRVRKKERESEREGVFMLNKSSYIYVRFFMYGTFAHHSIGETLFELLAR